ncbi:MAG: PHP domain-containing protein [Candidatus Roizmanbacteria bacterium]
MSNHDIATLLREVATSYGLQGVNRFRIIAYERAADAIEHLDQEIKDVHDNGIKLDSLSGIGSSLAEHLVEYFKNPKENYLLKQRATLPEAVYVLLNIPRIGPKNAFKLVTTFNLESAETAVDDLEKLAKEGKIAVLDGFGEKSQAEIISAIAVYHRRKSEPKRLSLPVAYQNAMEVVAYLKDHPKVLKIDVLGSLRRWEPTIGDVDIAVMCEDTDAPEIVEYFVNYPKKLRLEGKGNKKGSILVKDGLRIDLETVSKEQYGAMLQYFTGSKDHNIKLREYALKKDMSISEYGIKISSEFLVPSSELDKEITRKGDLVQFSTEEALYSFLGLDYIPPELRQGRDEIALSEKHNLPKIISKEDIRGDFHIHTNLDIEPSHDMGADSPEDLVKKGESLGYEYIGFADHNPSVGNHTSDQVIDIMKKRKYDIDEALSNKVERCNYFITLETDITPDGSLALPDEAFQYVDFLIVSIHSAFTQEKFKMTERILKALSYDQVKIMAHPTARLIGSREEINADWAAIFAYASEKNIAMEINAWYQRLDLPDYLIREAKKAGCKFVLSTDSHAVEHMDGMYYAVAMARRAGLVKDDIINCWEYEKVKEFLLSSPT